jgi:hypothetical protein
MNDELKRLGRQITLSSMEIAVDQLQEVAAALCRIGQKTLADTMCKHLDTLDVGIKAWKLHQSEGEHT